MIKQRTIPLEDSNLAFFGTELEKNVKKAAAETEEQWKGAGKEVGLQIWRIEKFKVVPWPKEDYGKFFSGDSYIILNTYKKNPESDALSWDVHFWLGLETTQDEAGTAAYKTVELDDVLNGAPVQHREVQGYESDLFLKYFKQILVQEGGVASGFKHVEPTKYRSRLLHVKGTANNVVVREVEKAVASLNTGDSFILDKGLTLYQFNGADASINEKLYGQQIVQAINDERGGKPEVIVCEQNESIPDEFWNELGGKGEIKPAAQGGDDKAVVADKKLFRLSDGEPAAAGSSKDAAAPTPAPAKPTVKDGPVIHPTPNFNAAEDVDNLKKAFRWFGTKHSVLISILGNRTREEREQIVAAFQERHKLALADRISRKTSYNFQKNLLNLITRQPVLDARSLQAAMKGLGTDEDTLIEIICSRKPGDLKAVIAAYSEEFQRDLATDVEKETSGDFKRFLLAILKGDRASSSEGVDQEQAQADAQALYNAGEKRWGTDEETFIRILSQRSLAQLRAIFEKYKSVSGKTIFESIESETSGDFKRAMLTFAQCVLRPATFYQEKLYKSMKGLGTNDDSLSRIICSRCDIDLGTIINEFNKTREVTLADMVYSDTSGSYRNLLLQLIGAAGHVPVKQVKSAASGDKGAFGMTITEVASGKVTRDLLDSSDVFLFDNGFEVFVWIGKNASRAEKKSGLSYAQNYLRSSGKPLWYPISRILEGGENEVFEASFDK